MKRKGFLGKILGGVLCAGLLVSMPMTASAADKADVVGEWQNGPMGKPVSFSEDGMATDCFNARAYHMESGSLEVTYSDGSTETVNYDLWRGETLQDTPVDKYKDAVIYKIIGPGKIKSWNVVKYADSSEWLADYGWSIITKGKKSAASSAGSCEHNYEWTVTTDPTKTEDGVISYMCVICGNVKEMQPVSADVAVRKSLLTSIKNAESGSTVTFSNSTWSCYPQYVLDALKEKGDVSLKTDFTYEGTNYSFTIPAGSDYSNLEQADFYGFMYLCGAFNGSVVE